MNKAMSRNVFFADSPIFAGFLASTTRQILHRFFLDERTKDDRETLGF